MAARRQRGAIFLLLLVVIAVMGLALGATGTYWSAVQTRERERELLFVGMQYRNAIRLYYLNSPGGQRYPPTLEALLQDERAPAIRRYLRRPYTDPMLRPGQAQAPAPAPAPVRLAGPESATALGWGLIEAPGGGIRGVYSLAPGRPLKQANFPAVLGWRGGGASYADWKFIYLPPTGEGGF